MLWILGFFVGQVIRLLKQVIGKRHFLMKAGFLPAQTGYENDSTELFQAQGRSWRTSYVRSEAKVAQTITLAGFIGQQKPKDDGLLTGPVLPDRLADMLHCRRQLS